MAVVKFILILTMIFLFVASGCASPQEDTPIVATEENILHVFYNEDEGIRIFNIDFLERYEDTINAMFNYEWVLLSVEEIFVVPEVFFTSGVPSPDPRPMQFIKWTIEYHDGNGDTKNFIFRNILPFSTQVEQHITHYIAEYFQENFFDVYLADIQLEYVSGVNFVYGRVIDCLDENREIIWEYRRQLETPEGAIRLDQLTPINAFEMFPFYLGLDVSLSNYDGVDQQGFEESVMLKVEEMIESMNQFTDYRLNAKIYMGYRWTTGVRPLMLLHTGDRYYNWIYIQGEQFFRGVQIFDVFFDEVLPDFRRYIFESYKGIFW